MIFISLLYYYYVCIEEKMEGTAMLKKDEDDTIRKHKNRITRNRASVKPMLSFVQ